MTRDTPDFNSREKQALEDRTSNLITAGAFPNVSTTLVEEGGALSDEELLSLETKYADELSRARDYFELDASSANIAVGDDNHKFVKYAYVLDDIPERVTMPVATDHEDATVALYILETDEAEAVIAAFWVRALDAPIQYFIVTPEAISEHPDAQSVRETIQN